MQKRRINIAKIEWIVFGLIAVTFFARAYLTTPLVAETTDFLNYYKFTSNDSYDWVANGLRLFSNDTITFRNPGLPLVIKALSSLGLIFLLPFMNYGAFFVLIVFTYLVTKRVANRAVGLVIAIAMAMNFTFITATSYILADMYAVALLAGALYFFMIKRYYLSLAMLGGSLLFQNIGYFFALIGAGFLLYENKDYIRKFIKRPNWHRIAKTVALCCLALMPIIAWNLYRLVLFGDPLYTKVEQFSLLHLDFDAVLFYGLNSLTMFGLIVVPAVCVVLWKYRSIVRNRDLRLLAVGLLFNTLFWVFLYDWTDRRFLLYFIPFAYPLIGYAISCIRAQKIAMAVAALLLLFPTILPVSSFATGNEFPLSHNRYLLFELQNDGSYTVKKQERSVYEGPALLYPALYVTHKNSARYRSAAGGTYTRYSEYLNNNYNPATGTLCHVRSNGYSRYVLTSLLFINYNAEVDKVKFDDCPAKL